MKQKLSKPGKLAPSKEHIKYCSHTDYPLITLFYFKMATLPEIAVKLAITEQLVLQKLQAEFKCLRNSTDVKNKA